MNSRKVSLKGMLPGALILTLVGIADGSRPLPVAHAWALYCCIWTEDCWPIDAGGWKDDYWGVHQSPLSIAVLYS